MAGGKLGIPRVIKDRTNLSVVLYHPLLLPVRARTQIQGIQSQDTDSGRTVASQPDESQEKLHGSNALPIIKIQHIGFL